MRRPLIRIRTFLLGTILVLVLVPTLAATAAWFAERDHQQAGIEQRLKTAIAYLTSHRTEMREPAAVQGFAHLLDQLNLLAQLTLGTNTPPGKSHLYVSPALLQAQQSHRRKADPPTTAPAPADERGALWADDGQRLIAVATSGSHATLAVNLYYLPACRATRALVALFSGVLVLLAGLAIALWLTVRWMVAPLARLNAQVNQVARGDLTIAVPRSRIYEVTNIAQGFEGMTAALGETAQQRAEADEARRFLVTSIAHDLRTPLFALRGHLQAIGSRMGNPAVHLQRAEARAGELDRLISNLFAYTRDDYAQPTLHFETVPIGDLLQEVSAGLEHATRLRNNTFELAGDQALAVVVDRDRSKRALSNLLDNALHYSPPGAPIHLSWIARDETAVEITVQDHGPGFDPDLLPHVFEPGIRGTRAADSPDSGSGLGLTIAKRLLEQQDSALSIHNQPTGGAEARVTVKRTPSATTQLT